MDGSKNPSVLECFWLVWMAKADKRYERKKRMEGTAMIGIGIGMIGLAIVLLIVSVVYSKTVGKKIREELWREYE